MSIDWDLAACLGCDPELWWANDRHRADVAEAIAICAGCAITSECLEAALAEESVMGNFNRSGIRGGLTALQRRRRAGKRRAA